MVVGCGCCNKTKEELESGRKKQRERQRKKETLIEDNAIESQ